jgi:predicted anti-sigma-YlaC factor YlaD
VSLNPVKNRRERCRAAREQMSEYIDGEPGPDTQALERHLGRCPNCRRMFQNLSRTVTALRSIGERPDLHGPDGKTS